jgi:eukaryotic-like serine/threonine-protein kinase
VAAVLNRARPVVEARGGPEQRYRFYEALNFQQLTKSRHFVDEDILANARAALKAAEEGCTDYVVGFALFELGFCLLFHGDLSEAEETLMAARRLGERMGEADMQMLCLSYLNLTALRRHDTAGVASLAPQARAVAEAASHPEYAAMARASLAWLAWNEGRLADVRPRADEALVSWETTVWHPFHWICLWPLIAVRVVAGETALAIAASRGLLQPPSSASPTTWRRR